MWLSKLSLYAVDQWISLGSDAQVIILRAARPTGDFSSSIVIQGYMGRVVHRPRFAGVRKFGRAVKMGLTGIASAAFRNRGARSRPRASRGATYGNLTFQNDESVVYKRHRAPKKIRRRHKRAFKTFQYNMDKLQSMKTCIIYERSLHTATPTGTSNGQACMGVTMYGYNTNTYAANIDRGNGDMPWIFARENGGYPTADDATRKLRFRSCVMEFTVTNELVAGATGDLQGILVLDIYYVIARKNNGVTADPAVFWNNSIQNEAAGNMPNAVVSYDRLGVTPFDASNFGRYWLVKKKRRVRLSPGQVFNFQMRDPGNYTLNMQDILNLKSKANLTEGVILVGYNSAYKFSDPDYVPGDVEYSVTYRKTYHYTETSSSIDAIGT